jgi:hypothetical protein
VASDAVKREFAVSYSSGRLGSVEYIVRARSQSEIEKRYPLFEVFEMDEATWLTAQQRGFLRAFPGPGRSEDTAISHLPEHERVALASSIHEERERALQRLQRAGHPDAFVDRAMAEQYWVDIDDDADFRVKMHDYWRDDPRYKELPPEKRLA